MGTDASSKLENKVSQLLSDTAKNILNVLEADLLGRVRANTDESYVEASNNEFQFIRKQVLDSINGTKRTIGQVLRHFDIQEIDKVIVNVKSDS